MTTIQENDLRFTPATYERAMRTYLCQWTSEGKRKPASRVCTWGPAGVGKTDIHSQIAKDWRRRLATIHLSQKNPADIQGIPLNVGGHVKWVVQGYFPGQFITVQTTNVATYNTSLPYAKFLIVRIETLDGDEVAVFGDGMRYSLGLEDYNPLKFNVSIDDVNQQITVNLGTTKTPYRIFIEDAAIFFLDDLSAAPKSVQKAGLQLINDYRVGDYDLPMSCPLAAASNRECDGAFIERMNLAVANRMMHITLLPSLQDTLHYFIRIGADSRLISYMTFLTMEPHGEENLWVEKLDTASLSNGKLGFQSPRSWERLAEQLPSCLEADNDMPDNFYGHNVSYRITPAMCAGFVGVKAAQHFLLHLSLYDKMPDPNDVLSGRITSLPAEYANDPGYQSGFAIKLATSLRNMRDRLNIDEKKPLYQQPKEFQNAVKYFCNFSVTQLRREIYVMQGSMMYHVYGISVAMFRGGNADGSHTAETEKYAMEVSKILTRVFIARRKRSGG